MKTELIAKLEELLLKDAGEVASEVRALQKEYQKLWTSEFEKARQAFTDDGSQLKKQNDAKIAAEQARNLTIRQEIIAKIKDLTHVSDHVGAALRMLQELQTQWKEAGPVSSHKYKDIQSEYSRAVEDMYYNIKIYRDLQDHDLKKNLEHKSELIEKLRAVQNIENIKEAERLIKVYRNEWEEIGPVPNTRWEALKHDYKTVLDETYAKIKSHYTAIEDQKEHNLSAKREIIEKTKELLNTMSASGKAAKWNESTEKLIELQNAWKHVGRTSEKENERIWAEFRGVCDEFFEKKREFFAGLSEKFSANRKIKNELITKAEALKDSTDWQKTGLELIRLQDEWKKYPSNGDKEEPRLFQKFRKACNTFFDAKKQHQESLEQAYVGNMQAKEAVLAQLQAFTLGEDANANREALKQISHNWNEAGQVPMKDKKRLNDAFYALIDGFYDQLHLDKKEKAVIQFKTKLDRMVSSENNVDQLRKESDFLRKQIDEISGRMRTYDNNLGFFKTAKGGSNAFMKEIEEKIELEKSRIADLTAKRKLVNEELNKLREAHTKS
jgi:archaellum component FlaC